MAWHCKPHKHPSNDVIDRPTGTTAPTRFPNQPQPFPSLELRFPSTAISSMAGLRLSPLLLNLQHPLRTVTHPSFLRPAFAVSVSRASSFVCGSPASKVSSRTALSKERWKGVALFSTSVGRGSRLEDEKRAGSSVEGKSEKVFMDS